MWGDTIDVSDKEMKVVLTKLIIFLDQTSPLRKAKHLFWQDVKIFKTFVEGLGVCFHCPAGETQSHLFLGTDCGLLTPLLSQIQVLCPGNPFFQGLMLL